MRTFVSTREATVTVQVVPRPTPVLHLLPPATLVDLPEAPRLLVEDGQPLLGGEVLRREQPPPGWPFGDPAFSTGRPPDHHHSAGQFLPDDLVPRPDAVLHGDRLGDGDLELAGDLGHFLTVTRTVSLSRRRWQGRRSAVASGLPPPRRPPCPRGRATRTGRSAGRRSPRRTARGPTPSTESCSAGTSGRSRAASTGSPT